MNVRSRPLVFAHIGDLHITDARQRNYLDFLAIVAQIDVECGASLDFVVLPGDNADNGAPAQYRLIATALKMLTCPVHILPGDHDMEKGSLSGFYADLGAKRLPHAVIIRGVRCLFVDVCGSGGGGPDFRMGAEQISWLENELSSATERGEASALFMHTYPEDLTGEGETQALIRLLDGHDVALVDMGHTHYNELANDGRTIFSATRSTGQIEEGPPGYTIASLDAGVVSWRFRALDDAFPFVIVTSPADYRLMRGAEQIVEGECEIRAIVLGSRAVKRVACRSRGEWVSMTRTEEGVWTARLPVDANAPTVPIVVRAEDETGRPGLHSVEVATRHYEPETRPREGSDRAAIDAWPENGVLGTQLGPNRNGKPLF